MKSAKQFLKSIDESKFESTIEILKKKLMEASEDDRIAILESAPIELYKKKQLVEYLDKNKDKLLAMDTFNEGDPVKVSDDFAPHASKNGKVLSKGSVSGSYKVQFDDGEYEIPEHHMSRQDVVANESKIPDAHSGEKKKIHRQITEHRALALLTDGSLVKVIIESFNGAEELIAENLDQDVLAVFPAVISESFVQELQEGEMTDAQKDRREEIVMAMKNSKGDLEKRYGDKWESVMYAIATKKAMEESLAEASADVIFKQKVGDATVTISKDGEHFTVKKTNYRGQVVDVKEFSNINEAEAAVQEQL